MVKVYQLSCGSLGIDCTFQTRADTVEAVVEKCADHARQEHGVKSFSPELFAKMRSGIKVLEE